MLCVFHSTNNEQRTKNKELSCDLREQTLVSAVLLPSSHQLHFERRHLHAEDLQQRCLVRRECVAFSTYRKVRQKLYHPFVQLCGHPVLPERRFHRVRNRIPVLQHRPRGYRKLLRRWCPCARVIEHLERVDHALDVRLRESREEQRRVAAHVVRQQVEVAPVLFGLRFAESNLEHLVRSQTERRRVPHFFSQALERLIPEILVPEQVHRRVRVELPLYLRDKTLLPLSILLLHLGQGHNLVPLRLWHVQRTL
mmetsp:Transcript_697/g.1822  ORF Transcript_697/g.1822 Transcript_697/m.1822 type:complete len:253 (-) Transcript_697:36-794(-)